MDKPSTFTPQIHTPKKVDKYGYDEDGVLHENCGTPECCNTCEPEEPRREKNDSQLKHEEKVFGK